MPSAARLEVPPSNSVESDAMALKRQMCDEIEFDTGSEKPEVATKPKKVFRRADTVQAVNLSKLVYEHIEVPGGLVKYKPSSSIHELRLNLTTKEHKVIVQKASLEENDRSKFEFDVPGGSILADLTKFISAVAAAPLVQKRLDVGHRFVTPLKSNMIHATVDFRQNALRPPTVFEVMDENGTMVSNFAELNEAMWKMAGFCDWEATVQVAPCVYFMEKGSEPLVILCLYVTQIHLTKSRPVRRAPVPQDLLEV